MLNIDAKLNLNVDQAKRDIEAIFKASSLKFKIDAKEASENIRKEVTGKTQVIHEKVIKIREVHERIAKDGKTEKKNNESVVNQKSINDLAVNMKEAVKTAFEDGIGNVKVKTQSGGLFSSLLSPITSVARGSFEGIGRDLTKGLGTTVVSNIEKEISPLIGSFDLIGKQIGKDLGQGIIFALEGGLDKTSALFADILGQEAIALEASGVRARDSAKGIDLYTNSLKQLASETKVIAANQGFLKGQAKSIDGFRKIVLESKANLDKLLSSAYEKRGFNENIKKIDDINNEIDSKQSQIEGLGSSSDEIKQIDKLSNEIKKLKLEKEKYSKQNESIQSRIEAALKNEIFQVKILEGELERLEFQFKQIVGRFNELDRLAKTTKFIPGGQDLTLLSQRMKESMQSPDLAEARYASGSRRIDAALSQSGQLQEKILDDYRQKQDDIKAIIAQGNLSIETIEKLELITKKIKNDARLLLSKTTSNLKDTVVEFVSFERSLLQESPSLIAPSQSAEKPTLNTSQAAINAESSQKVKPKNTPQAVKTDLNLENLEKAKERNKKALQQDAEETNLALQIYQIVVEETLKESGLNPEDVKNILPKLTTHKSLLDEVKGAGGNGAYSPDKNIIRTTRDTYKKLLSGDFKDKDIGTLAHEVRHGIQYGFTGETDDQGIPREGLLKKFKKLKDLSVSEKDKSEILRGIQSSTGEKGPVRALLEEDAYTFEASVQDKIVKKVRDFVENVKKEYKALPQNSKTEDLRQDYSQRLKENPREFLDSKEFSRKGLQTAGKAMGIDNKLTSAAKKAELAELLIMEIQKGRGEELAQTLAEYGDSIKNISYQTGVASVKGTVDIGGTIDDIRASVKFLYQKIAELPDDATKQSSRLLDGLINNIVSIILEIKSLPQGLIKGSDAKILGGFKTSLIKLNEKLGDAVGESVKLDFTTLVEDLDRYVQGVNKSTLGHISEVEATLEHISELTLTDKGIGEKVKELESHIEAQVVDDFEAKFKALENEVQDQISSVTDDDFEARFKALENEVQDPPDDSNLLYSFENLNKNLDEYFSDIEEEIDRLNKELENEKKKPTNASSRQQRSEREAYAERNQPPPINTEDYTSKTWDALDRLDRATRNYTHHVEDLENAANSNFQNETLRLEHPIDNLQRGVRSVRNVVREATGQVTGFINRLRERFQGIDAIFKGALLGLSGFIATRFLDFDSIFSSFQELSRKILEDAIAFESLQKSIEFTSGSAEKGARSLKFITDEAARLKVNMQSAVKGYQQLSASSQGNTKLQALVNDTASAIFQSGRALNLPTEQLDRAIVALSQMAAKGVISQEELRGQLSEAIPNALQIASRAFGVTTTELNKMVEEGINADVFLSKFSAQLKRETFFAAIQGSDTLGASLTNLQNQAFLTRNALGQEFAGGAKSGMDALAKILQVVADNAELIHTALQLGVFGSGVLLFNLVKGALPWILVQVGKINGFLGITSALTRLIRVESNDLTPNFTRMALSLQKLQGALSPIAGLFQKIRRDYSNLTGGIPVKFGFVESIKQQFNNFRNSLRSSINNFPVSKGLDQGLGDFVYKSKKAMGELSSFTQKPLESLNRALGQFGSIGDPKKILNDLNQGVKNLYKTIGIGFRQNLKQQFNKVKEIYNEGASPILKGLGDFVYKSKNAMGELSSFTQKPLESLNRALGQFGSIGDPKKILNDLDQGVKNLYKTIGIGFVGNLKQQFNKVKEIYNEGAFPKLPINGFMYNAQRELFNFKNGISNLIVSGINNFPIFKGLDQRLNDFVYKAKKAMGELSSFPKNSLESLNRALGQFGSIGDPKKILNDLNQGVKNLYKTIGTGFVGNLKQQFNKVKEIYNEGAFPKLPINGFMYNAQRELFNFKNGISNLAAHGFNSSPIFKGLDQRLNDFVYKAKKAMGELSSFPKNPLQSLNSALGQLGSIGSPKKILNDLDRGIKNLYKTLGTDIGKTGFGRGLKAISQGAFEGLKVVNQLGGAIAGFALQFIAFDAAFKLFDTVAKARSEISKLNAELVKFDIALNLSMAKSSQGNISGQLDVRKKALLDEQNFYIKLLNPVSNIRKLGGGRTINESILDQRVELDNQQIADANSRLIDYGNILSLSKANKVSGESVTKAIDAAQARLDALRNVAPTTVSGQKNLDKTITDTEKLIDQLKKEEERLLGLSNAYGDLGQARIRSLELSQKEEIKSIALIDQQIRDGVINYEKGEALKLKAKLKRIESDIAANKLFLSQLPTNTEIKDRQKIETKLNELTKEGFDLRSQIRQNEFAEIDKLAAATISKATLAEQERQINILKLEELGVIGKEEAEKLKSESTIERIKLELKAEEEKIKAINALNGNDSTKADQLNAAKQSRNSKIIELLNAEISAQQSLGSISGSTGETIEDSLDKEIELRKKALDVTQGQLDIESQRLDVTIKIKDRIKELEQARYDFFKSVSDGENSLGDLRIQQLRRAIEIRRQLTGEDSDNLSDEQKRALEEELASLGVDARRSEASIVKEIGQIERENSDRKLKALEKEFEFRQKSLNLEIEKSRLESRKSLLESRKGVLEGEKAILEAKNNLDKAQTEEERSIAEKELEIAQSKLAIAKQQLDLENDYVNQLEEQNRIKQQQLDNDKRVAITTERVNQNTKNNEIRNEAAAANRDEISLLEEERKRKIEEAKAAAKRSKEGGKALQDRITEINKEYTEKIASANERINRGNNIRNVPGITPVIPDSSGITTPSNTRSPYVAPFLPNIPGYNGNIQKPHPSILSDAKPLPFSTQLNIDFKDIKGQLTAILSHLSKVKGNTVTANVEVATKDNNEMLRQLSNVIKDSVAVAYNY